MSPTFKNNIEYIQYPPPSKLKKAMEESWAEVLIKKGICRLTNVLEYRKPNPTNPDQSDPYEDIGEKICQGHKCTTTTVHPNYLWCCAEYQANSTELLDIDSRYNCIISLNDPQLFFELVYQYLETNNYTCMAQAGFVQYDKGEPENEQYWGDNSFQKHNNYAYQREYRLSIKELKKIEGTPFIDLELGDCSHIFSIQKL